MLARRLHLPPTTASKQKEKSRMNKQVIRKAKANPGEQYDKEPWFSEGVPGPAATVSPGDWLGIHIPRPPPPELQMLQAGLSRGC